MKTEYGNDTACTNCGDEWSSLDGGLCVECAEVLREDEQD